MHRQVALAFALSSATLWFAACGDDEATDDSLCDSGALVFCKCRGNEPGTKQCNSAGDGFDECVSDSTFEACEEIPTPTGTDSGTSSSTGTGTGGTGTETGTTTGTGTGALLSPCTDGSQCQTGMCDQGVCTKVCASYTECVDGGAAGECINFTGSPVCVPYCQTTGDCAPYGTACGYTLALDGMPFTVCGSWGDPVPTPPDGTMCMDDIECDLDNQGVQRICLFNTCTEGCYPASPGFDYCPAGTVCSSDGVNPGVCE